MAITKISMAKLEPSLSGEFDAHYRLKDALEQVRGRYQYIFIDTPADPGPDHPQRPGRGAITSSSLSSLPTSAWRGPTTFWRRSRRSSGSPIPISRSWAWSSRSMTREPTWPGMSSSASTMSSGTKLFKTYISKSVKLEESPAYKESIFTYAPGSKGAEQYRKVAEELLSRAKN
ncbi:MAG: ParA family protein [Desulfobacterales bacterium]|nr:ParA family protein [Desulfobacterales bacterium]